MRLILLTFLVMSVATAKAQIYSESFSGQNEVGIAGACDSVPQTCSTYNFPDSIDWTINGDASSLTETSDWFKVVSEKLEARDVESEVCFMSPMIDISTSGNAELSMVISEVGDHEESDYVDVSIVLDGVSTLIPEWIGNNPAHTIIGDVPFDADWGSTTFTQGGLSGDSLRVVVCIMNNATDEKIRINDIAVTESDPSCGISDLITEFTICDSIIEGVNTYQVVVSYSGSDPLAIAINNSSSGTITAGDTLGDLTGSDIVLEWVSAFHDWEIIISGGLCFDTIGGLAPLCIEGGTVNDILINEVDCDQGGVDNEEFIELFGPLGLSLDSLVLVLYNGGDNASYASYDLDGYALNSSGFFVICFGANNSGYCDYDAGGSLQNGADGVGLYAGFDAEDFTDNTPITIDGLIDGLRYDTNDGDDTGLAILDTDSDCGGSCQINEDEYGNSEEHSIQRGSWYVGSPTPGAINITDPLPVELIRFDAYLKNNATLLTWETAWELHNDYFLIEHSADSRTFSQVGILDGKHISRDIVSYEFVHELNREGRHYYRLKQVDEDGSVDYSGIRVVNYKASNITIAPSMTNDIINVYWSFKGEINVRVHSLQGELVSAKSKLFGGSAQISLQDIPVGVYLLLVESQGKMESFKVLRF